MESEEGVCQSCKCRSDSLDDSDINVTCDKDHLYCNGCENEMINNWTTHLFKTGKTSDEVKKIIVKNSDNLYNLPKEFCFGCQEEKAIKLHAKKLAEFRLNCSDLIEVHPKLKQFADLTKLKVEDWDTNAYKKRFREIINRGSEDSKKKKVESPSSEENIVPVRKDAGTKVGDTAPKSEE